MDVLAAIDARKSVRSYQNKAVEAEKIETLLRAAKTAPRAGELDISVVLNSGLLMEINEKALAAMRSSGNDFLMERAALPGYQPLYGAPLLLLFSAPKANPYGQANASNAATCAALAATAQGLGSCYVVTPTLALNQDAELASRVGIPVGGQCQCGLLAGYAGPEKFAAPRQFAGSVHYCR